MTNFEKTIQAKCPCDCAAALDVPGFSRHSPMCAFVLASQVFLDIKKEAIRDFIMSQSGISEFIAEINESNHA